MRPYLIVGGSQLKKQNTMNVHKAITARLNSLVGVTKPKGRNTFKKRATATTNKIVN